MAQIANSFATFNSSRVREELKDKIWNVSVSETPTLALVGKEPVETTNPNWLTDSFRAGASNKKEQGNAATPTARTDVVRYSNWTQISDDTFAITGTQEAVDKAGGQSEVAKQEAKSMTEVKKDVEFGFLQNSTSIAPASGVAPQARGLLGFIATNTDFGSGGANPNPLTNTAQTDGTLRTAAESQLKTVLQKMFDSGAPMDNLYAMIPSNLRSTYDGFLAGQTRFDKAEDKTLTATLEVYIGPFGRVKFVNARHMRTREVFVLNPEYAKLGILRKMDTKEIGRRGDAIERQTIVEWTTIVKNEKALAAMRDLQP